MIGLFQGTSSFQSNIVFFNTNLPSELGPCNVTANLTTEVNPYSFNEVSNLLFLSQPLGVGFSYSSEGVGSLNPGMLSIQMHKNHKSTIGGYYPDRNILGQS